MYYIKIKKKNKYIVDFIQFTVVKIKKIGCKAYEKTIAFKINKILV